MGLSRTPLSDYFSEDVMKVLAEYQEVVEKYQDKFGENSLERVILPDPFDTTLAGYLEIMEELEQAIEKNVPIEQWDEEAWRTLVF